MTAISKENRAEWKALAQECAAENIACYPTTPEEFLDILDALENAEARAEKAEAERDALIEHIIAYSTSNGRYTCDFCPAFGNNCRDLSDDSEHDDNADGDFCDYDLSDCPAFIRGWAAVQAEKEGAK